MSERLSRLRIVVLGYLVRGPIGGMAWHHIQYARGLADLGHDVYFIEDSDDYPSCYNPGRGITDTDPSYGLRFAKNAFDRIRLGDRWGYYDAHASRWHGPLGDGIVDLASRADLLLNVSGVNPLRQWASSVPVRVLIDTDPAFTQIRHLTDGAARERALRHTSFFSFAENIANGNATIPLDGLPWRATRQPVVLAAWPACDPPADGKFTTVMQWDSYASQDYEGRQYGMKSKSFMPFIDLPSKVGGRLELALGSPSAPRSLLAAKGWLVVNPLVVTRDPWRYQRYIQGSQAEFSVAKHGYAVTNSGWFSERSAAYLATGRPVVLQDTGFSAHLPCGRGLFAVKDADEAAAAINAIASDPAAHGRAAREIAAAHFDSRLCLSRLLGEIGQ